jgi:hypothetical protein
MDHQKPEQQASEYKVVSGIRVVEETVEIQKPVFRDVDVERPNYVDKEVEIPKLDLEKVAQSIADLAMSHILSKLEAKLDQAIKGRLDTIEVPKIVEKVNIVDRDVVVERPVFRDVEVTNAVVKDVTVNNAVVKDVPVTNAVIKDMEVTNAILQDKVVINPVFKDIEIDRPFYKDKEIVCIHPKYIDLQGRDAK